MTTPILDFVRTYAEKRVARFHMPGHKGRARLGCEALDITEIDGADVLYAPSGVIAESEANATALFGTAHTYYSAEGSSLAIKAMLALVTAGKKAPRILAARNVHKVFLYAAALLDFEIEWLPIEESRHIASTVVTARSVEKTLAEASTLPDAVYVTSPDYLGVLLDIKGIAAVCRRFGVPLLVDNAHGAHLHALGQHPTALGAAMCADSAHKTLPVLTGGAYLHIAKDFAGYTEGARAMLALFASTSPSYLILQSLDLCNALFTKYAENVVKKAKRLDKMKQVLLASGFPVLESEPLKLVLDAPRFGYTGTELAEHLRKAGVESEFADAEVLVLMVSPDNSEEDFALLGGALIGIPQKEPLFVPPLVLPRAERVLSVRAAILAEQESLPIEQARGKICAAPTVSCPPAVPILVSGERIEDTHIALFKRYGITEISVVR